MRVVGTCAYIPGHVDTQQGLLIRFAPYTALQIAEILRFKVRKCYEKIEIKNINTASNTGHTPTVSPGATAIATFARSFMGSGESPIPSTNNGPNKLKSMMAIIDHEKAMHFFLAYSSHIDILYQLIISVNSILCDEAETRSSKIRGGGGGGGNVELTYAQIENAFRAMLNPSSRPMTTISTSNAAISSSSNATSGRVFSFINDGSALGVALAEKERLKEQSIWVKSIPLSQQFLILSVFLAASNPKQSDAFTFGASNRGRRKLSHTDLGRRGGKKRKSSDGDDLDDPITESAVTSTTSRNKTKRSTIHSSSSYPDPNITGQDNDYDDNDDGNGRGDISNSQIAKDKKEFSQTNSRKFSLERVFGIMGQVACHCGVHVLNGGEQAARALGRSVGMIDVGMTVDQVMSSYGGSQLFAQVSE